MQKLLFIGHDYHRKTKSADFMIDMLAEHYEVTKFYFDPYNQDINTAFNSLDGQEYDVVVTWQVTPDIKELQQMIKCQHFVFFPMFDQMEHSKNEFWRTYDNVKIISFSKTLADRLKKLGVDCHYIQYFPEPIAYKKTRRKFGIFFWQRRNCISVNTVKNLFANLEIKRLHLHKAVDPNHVFTDVKDNKIKITYSDWFNNKQELLDKIAEFPIYIAPRPSEGIGMSFLEAMAMGRCVVAPDKPTMNEYIEHGKTGILYKWGNIKPLEPFDAQQIGENAYRYIQKGFAKWQKDKMKIFDWLQEPVKSHIKQYDKKITYKFFGFIPLLSIEEK